MGTHAAAVRLWEKRHPEMAKLVNNRTNRALQALRANHPDEYQEIVERLRADDYKSVE